MEIAILIPCYNEGATIYNVVQKFKATLPQAMIYVYDNCSGDNTADEARRAGAIVKYEKNRGKGNVIKSMFRDIEADVYVMIDGDMTYNIADTPKMIELLTDKHLDMVVAARQKASNNSYPACHEFGNKLYNLVMRVMFGGKFEDIFSGFRVFSRNFVKSFNVTAEGFDIEAEMTIYSLVTNKQCEEIPSEYYSRPVGSYSKLNTIKDGFKILFKMLSLFKSYKLQQICRY